ncbi:MAG: LCP family protein [Solobacterium sp.]|nr:LCP family protein [Solobacterium sp.]
MTNKNTVSEETVERKHMKPKQNQKGVFKQDMTIGNAILTLLAVIADVLVVYFMFNTTRFANLSKTAFILVNLAVLALLILINILAMFAIRTRKVRLFVTSGVLICAILGIGAYGSYAAAKVNRNIDKITNTTVEESVSTSLVVYNGEGSDSLTDVSQLDGRTVGYASGTHTAELGKNQIDSKGIRASYQEYQDYSAVILALFSGDIDCAILPTNYPSIFQNESGMSSALEQTASILDFEDTVTVTNSAGADKDITKEPFTVLLIGNADGLSDTMILCSVNPIAMTVTMSSLARDSYVPISCYGGGYSKLNASHAVSKQCTIDTIESLVGVDIDYYIDTNFQGVVDIVDALDGIVVDSPIAFVGQSSSTQRGHYTVYVPAGEDVRLNGEQALAFARERHLFATGDFARQEHQQEVIEAIIRKMMRTRDVNTFLKVLEAAGNNIQTNLTVDQMTSFVSYALQKTNRYYDSEHLEKVLQLRTSRVTGYSSNLWDSGSKILLYIYRLWNGSLADTRKAITRNTDLASMITAATDRIKWSINWEFSPAPISYDLYAEAQIPGDTIPAEYACGENQFLNEDGKCTCNAGFTMDANGGCVVQTTPTPTATPTPTPSTAPTPTPTPTPDDDEPTPTPDQTTPEPTPTPDQSTPEPPAPTPDQSTPEPPAPTPVTCGESAYESGGACYCNEGYTGDPYTACYVIIPDPTPDNGGGGGDDAGNGETEGGEG